MGTVGLRVCEQLRAAGAEVVGIEQDPSPALMAAARRLEVPLVAGDASDASTLASAGAGKARCVVAVTDDDVVNLEAGLTARALQPDTRVVLRLFDPDLADRVDRRLGLSVSRSVSYAAAPPVFAAAMMGRQVLAAIPAGRRVLLVAAVPIGARSSLDGASLSTVDSGRVRIFGLRTGNAEPVWQPPGESRLVAGQVLFVVATRAGLAKILVASGAH
nr:NAD-binding protein [Fodinicola feengrottensis]